MARAKGGRRTDYEWISQCGRMSQLDLTTGSVALGTGAFDLTGPGTVMRLRGRFYAQLDIGGVDERAVIAVGVIKVSDEALAAGVASIPSPDTDGDAEWIWHGYLIVSAGAEAAVVTDAMFDRVEVDSKAMRRFKASDSLAVVAEVCDSSDQAGTADLMYGLRLLLGS